MNVLKVVVVICTVVFSIQVFSMGDSNKEPELVPDPSTYSALNVKTPEQIREEAYQSLVTELQQIQSTDSENENPTVEIYILPQASIDESQVYDFLMGVMKDMPEGSNNGFEYSKALSMVVVQVNQAGVEYLYSLGTVYFEHSSKLRMFSQ